MADKIDVCHLKTKNLNITGDDKHDACDYSVITVIGNNNKTNVIENATRTTKNHDDSEKNGFDRVKTEVIILNEAPVEKLSMNNVKLGDNRRVIELSDGMSKMELRRHFKMAAGGGEGAGGAPSGSRRNHRVDDDDDDDGADILSRLPPGTVLIKQRNNNNARPGSSRICEDSDYVHESTSKDSTESNSSGGSSSATLYTPAGKIKRMQHRTVRSKKIVEVRRNPARNKKKKPMDEDFSRPRQRLMSVKRKSTFVVDPVTRKRAKTTGVPYMNTRSVTRKLYNVGATYQAPTIKDATQWKQWPSHGMHERPVWHPQFGLTYNYNDRHYISLDGLDYREIVDDPLIEVVSVDPRTDRLLRSNLGHDVETKKSITDHRTNDTTTFENCMHESLHSVLAYCARVVTPTYKNFVNAKTTKSNDLAEIGKFESKKSSTQKSISTDDGRLRNEKNNVSQTSTTQSSCLGKISETMNDQSSIAGCSSSTKRLVVPRRTISFTNVRNIQGNILHEVFGRASKNTLIFLKPTEQPAKSEKIVTIGTETFGKSNGKLSNDEKIDENAISDEALMEISSVYNKLLTNVDTDISAKIGTENNAKKSVNVANPISKTLTSSENRENGPTNGTRNFSTSSSVHDFDKSNNAEISRDSKFSNVNQAAEIAKILAEYNRKAAKKSATKNHSLNSSNSSNAKTITHPESKFTNHIEENSAIRTTILSIVEQSKIVKKHNDFSGKSFNDCNVKSNEENNENNSSVNDKDVKNNISRANEDSATITNDRDRAIDLSTAKSQKFDVQTPEHEKIDETTNRQWLRELIEDTAILYCAAAGVRQDDVADYLDTLDSNQSMEWLGS